MNKVFYPADYRNTVKGQPLVQGQKVYSGLYGGRYGIVVAIHGAQKPSSIGSIGNVVSVGGNAYFDIVFEASKSMKLPESILHGVQWRIFPDVASADEILDAIAICEASLAKKAAEEKAKSDARAALAEKIKADNPHLIQIVGSGLHPGKCAAKNIRIELKKAFPKVKFSVTSDYNSVRVSYDDGPCLKKVDAICSKYKAGNFNGMTDSYDFNDDAVWASVFGDPQYVFCSRGVSDSNMEAIVDGFASGKKPEDYLPKDMAHGGKWTYRDIASDIVREKDIPVGKKVVGLKRTDCEAGSHSEFYELECA